MSATDPNEKEAQAIIDELRRDGTIQARLQEAEETPLHAATFYPDEAEELGFFLEQALTTDEAEDAMLDNDRAAE